MRPRIRSILLRFLATALFLAQWTGARAREPVKPVSLVPAAQIEIDRAWAALDYEMTLNEIDEAIRHLEKARDLDPDNPEILVELADESFQRGDQMPRETDAEYEARNVYFARGYEAAQQALALRETAGAHYWVAVNLAAGSENKSLFRRARIFPGLKAHMTWIEKHDRDYKYGAAARFLSKLTTRVPGVLVKMVGEDPSRIFGDLEAAIRAEPRFIDNYVYKAEFYRHMGRDEEALALLDQVLAMDPEAFPQERAYNRYAQRKARALREAWTGTAPLDP